MQIWEAVLLGVVQGVTEFLPISSSGHLLIVQHLLGFQHELITFDIVIHLATLVAILLFFGKSLLHVSFREWFLVGLGTIPAVIAGLFFKDAIEALFGADVWVGVQLIITGLIVFATDWWLAHQDEMRQRTKMTTQNNPVKALVIGVAQAIAIIPAISRSGSTVAGAIAMGLDREQAFRYSFLLAIPAIAGAGVLEFKDVYEAGETALLVSPPYLAGAVAALVTGILSLKLFKYVIDKAKLEWFGWYCVVVGGLITAYFLVLAR